MNILRELIAIKNARRIIVFILVVFSAISVLSSCQKAEEASISLETVDYHHITGYQVSVPQTWNLIQQDSSGGVYFLSADKHISLNILAEVGGMNYLNPEELSDSVFEKLSGVIKNAKVVKILAVKNKDREYRQLIEGADSQGDHVYIDAYLCQPMDGMRYYLFLTAGGDDYTVNKPVYDNIINSFVITSGQDEIYSLFTLDEEELAEKLSHGLETVFKD